MKSMPNSKELRWWLLNALENIQFLASMRTPTGKMTFKYFYSTERLISQLEAILKEARKKLAKKKTT